LGIRTSKASLLHRTDDYIDFTPSLPPHFTTKFRPSTTFRRLLLAILIWLLWESSCITFGYENYKQFFVKRLYFKFGCGKQWISSFVLHFLYFCKLKKHDKSQVLPSLIQNHRYAI